MATAGSISLAPTRTAAAVVARNRGTEAVSLPGGPAEVGNRTGDQRINSFGIGGEVEVRRASTCRSSSSPPVVHIGLGEATRAEVARDLLAQRHDPVGVRPRRPTRRSPPSQRLKGSCPWLFAWNGREMSFVTDLIWRSPLGLRINAQATASIQTTEDWVKLRGNQLAPRDGAYDLRITAELWETHFFDLVVAARRRSPAGTEIFVDERFAVPAPALDVQPDRPGPAVCLGAGRRGGDVAAIVGARDGRHLDFAGRGAYQGVTRDHWVELALGDDAPRTGPLWLVAQGWVHPTDSSINVAHRPGRRMTPPQGLSLEVADARGWLRTVARQPRLSGRQGQDNPGRPGGRLPRPGPRRLRLRDEPRDLLGSPRLGRRQAGRPRRPARPCRCVGGPALPWISRRSTQPDAEHARAAALRRRGDDAAMARPRRLLHAIRRRAASCSRRSTTAT